MHWKPSYTTRTLVVYYTSEYEIPLGESVRKRTLVAASRGPQLRAPHEGWTFPLHGLTFLFWNICVTARRPLQAMLHCGGSTSQATPPTYITRTLYDLPFPPPSMVVSRVELPPLYNPSDPFSVHHSYTLRLTKLYASTRSKGRIPSPGRFATSSVGVLGVPGAKTQRTRSPAKGSSLQRLV